MFGVLHFLYIPGQPAALSHDDIGYAWAPDLKTARTEFARRVRTGRARFTPLPYVNPITRATYTPSGTVSDLPATCHAGSEMRLYPLETRTVGRRTSYMPDTEHPVYTLALGDDNVITVTDRQSEYVCNGAGCRADIKYTARGWVHTSDQSRISDVCEFVAVNGRDYPAHPITRRAVEIAERSRAARRAMLAVNPLNWP